MSTYINNEQNSEKVEVLDPTVADLRMDDSNDSSNANMLQESDFEELDEFVPRRPEPFTWPVKTRKFYISPKDKVYITVLLILISVLLVTAVSICIWANLSSPATPDNDGRGDSVNAVYPYASNQENFQPGTMSDDAMTVTSDDINSKNAVVLDVSTMQFTAGKSSGEQVWPASLTKVMTLVTVVENLKSAGALQDEIIISEEVYNRMKAANSSGANFDIGEKFSVESLLYALILESDGMAACELANYISGSEEAFVGLMNQKAQDMGLTGTNFTNSTGLHDNNHYSTCRDLASIMAYAMNNELCRKVLTEDYIAITCEQPSGRQFTYYFSHRLLKKQFETNPNNQPNNATVIAGKTGLTDESGSCLVTYAETPEGKGYVVVTTNAKSTAECMDDYIWLYQNCIK